MVFYSKAVWNFLIELQSSAVVAVDMDGKFVGWMQTGDGGLLNDGHDVIVWFVFDACCDVV